MQKMILLLLLLQSLSLSLASSSNQTWCNSCAALKSCSDSYFLTEDEDCDAEELTRFETFTNSFYVKVPAADLVHYTDAHSAVVALNLFNEYGPTCNDLETPILNSAKNGYFCSCVDNCDNEYTDDTLNDLLVVFMVVTGLHMLLQVYTRLAVENACPVEAEAKLGSVFPGTNPVPVPVTAEGKLKWRRMAINSINGNAA